jgi:arylsulfatase
VYNFLGLARYTIAAPQALAAGHATVMLDFAYDGGGLGKGGTATLYVDGKQAGEGRVRATAPMVFSADDGCDVGRDTGAAVSPDYGVRGNAFNGVVKGVQLAIAEDARAADHLVTPQHALAVAMARQ